MSTTEKKAKKDAAIHRADNEPRSACHDMPMISGHCIGCRMPAVSSGTPAEHVLVTPETCDCDKRSDDPCPVCDGGLAICSICHKAEVDLDGPCIPRQPSDTPAAPEADALHVHAPDSDGKCRVCRRQVTAPLRLGDDGVAPPERVWIENNPPTGDSPLVVTEVDKSHEPRFTEYIEKSAHQKEVDLLHVAICQAVALMNMVIHEQSESRQAHEILRQALIDYADRAAARDALKGKEIDG